MRVFLIVLSNVCVRARVRACVRACVCMCVSNMLLGQGWKEDKLRDKVTKATFRTDESQVVCVCVCVCVRACMCVRLG